MGKPYTWVVFCTMEAMVTRYSNNACASCYVQLQRAYTKYSNGGSATCLTDGWWKYHNQRIMEEYDDNAVRSIKR